MAKKIKIQHLYTTGSTSVNDIKTPTGLALGEIAIDASPGFEDIKISNGSGQTVSAINGHKKAQASYFHELFDNPSADIYGHVALSDTIETKPTNPSQILKGVAASIYHTHEGYVSADDTDYQNMKIFLSGATFNPEVVSAATDTLKEIQDLLGNGENADATNLISAVNNIKTSYISGIYTGDKSLIKKFMTKPGETGTYTEISHSENLMKNSFDLQQTQEENGINGDDKTYNFRINTINKIDVINGHITGISNNYIYLPMAEVNYIEYDNMFYASSGFSKNIGLTRLYAGDLNVFKNDFINENIDGQLNGDTLLKAKTAASIYHTHSQYLEATSISTEGEDTILTISCGTY